MIRSTFNLLLLLVFLLFPVYTSAQSHKNMLSAYCNPSFLTTQVKGAGEWHPFPKAGERDAWQKLVSPALREKYIADGERLLNHTWTVLPVNRFLDFYRNGDRNKYQSVIFQRRKDVASLVMAEVIEGKGRFTDDIINGIWAICEETFWGVPAHIGYRDKTKGFPDAENPFVDLFAAETGSLVAWTYYLLGNELDSVSPIIRHRMYTEVNNRILKPCHDSTFWWMGFDGKKVINWNVWINSNLLTCILLMEKDPALKSAYLDRTMKSIDTFIDGYTNDGGCDEGPSYWTRAGGALYQCLDLLYDASGGKINVYGNSKIKEIGKYIYRMHICDGYFVNFADASAIVTPDPGILYNIGKRISDDKMLGFASFFAQRTGYGSNPVVTEFGSLYNTLSSFEAARELQSIAPHAPLLADSWLPDIQVCTARSSAGDCKGFFFGAKGGNNAESHNHNDVGSFILYYNGLPFIIDAGVGEYTAKTFSSRRYEIWTMQSAYHNLPAINGVMQHDGIDFRATDVRFSTDKNKTTFSMDIAHAYPTEANVNSWKRTYTFERKKGLEMEDQFNLKSFVSPSELSFMTLPEPVLKKGSIEFTVDNQVVQLVYPESMFTVAVDKVDFTDSRLHSSWKQDYLYRIRLTLVKKDLQGEYKMRIGL